MSELDTQFFYTSSRLHSERQPPEEVRGALASDILTELLCMVTCLVSMRFRVMRVIIDGRPLEKLAHCAQLRAMYIKLQRYLTEFKQKLSISSEILTVAFFCLFCLQNWLSELRSENNLRD